MGTFVEDLSETNSTYYGMPGFYTLLLYSTLRRAQLVTLPGWVASCADPNGLQHATGSELLHGSLRVEAAK